MVSKAGKVAVLANLEKTGVRQAYDHVEKWAVASGRELVSNLDGKTSEPGVGSPFGFADPQTLADRYAGADILITMGGDGTLLYAAQVTGGGKIPVLSINLGSLGFHTQVSPHNLDSCLSHIGDGNFAVENRMILEAQVESPLGGSKTTLALNDIVVAKSAWGHMVTLHIKADGETVSDVAADALIVCSPTGSSAYNYAAGGPVLYPNMDAIVLNALCAHRMRVSPVVIPGSCELEVTLKPRRTGDFAQVLNDGQPWQKIAEHVTLKISKASMYLPLIVFENDFYGKLREKLRWGGLF